MERTGMGISCQYSRARERDGQPTVLPNAEVRSQNAKRRRITEEGKPAAPELLLFILHSDFLLLHYGEGQEAGGDGRYLSHAHRARGADRDHESLRHGN